MNQDDWQPTATVEDLQRRSQVLWSVRNFFQQRGYAEVQTPTISRDTVIDRYIDPIEVAGRAIGSQAATAERYFLQTSPEFCMKRLLAAGMRSIVQMGPAYRAGERGQFHNPEFTMLEWYCVGQEFEQSVDFLGELVGTVLHSAAPAIFRAAVEIISYREAFERTVSLDPFACTEHDLSKTARNKGISLGSSWEGQTRDDWLNLLFAECVQPQLGCQQPVIVTHYPATQAALSAIAPEDPRTAQRYEMFVHGVELANGYRELLDASELLRRSRQVLEQRRRDGKAELDTDNRLLSAMRSGLPDCCGCALGVDRLVMLALQRERIEQVIPFPMERA